MFSGIVESKAQILSAKWEGGLVAIEVGRPPSFDDLRIGDSVCTNGVCLTVDLLQSDRVRFVLGHETLQVTKWTAEGLQGQWVNLERSLKWSDRVHGHMVSGHVDGLGLVQKVTYQEGSLIIDIQPPQALLSYIWQKGSWAVNGVSLTVNSIHAGTVSVCLIPETQRRTQLSDLKAGDHVNLEIDMMARGMVQFMEQAAQSGRLTEWLRLAEK